MIGRKFVRLARMFALGTAVVSADRLVAQTAVTFEKVFEYVELGVDEAKISRLVQSSPTKFVLGAEQVARLRNAGATETLIETIQKPGSPVEASSNVSDFVVILDCSGSMNDRLADGSSKWEAARRAAIELVKEVPDLRGVVFR